jgi:hypothetical protein
VLISFFYAATFDLPAGFTSEYKFVHYIPGQEPIWEFTENRFLSIPKSAIADPQGVALDLAWCEPSAVFGEEQSIIFTGPTSAAAVVSDTIVDGEYPVQDGLVTPAFQSAVSSVAAFFGGASTEEEEKMAEQGSEDVAALEAAFGADAAMKQQTEEEVEKKTEEEITIPSAEAFAAVADFEEEENEEDAVTADLAKPSAESNSMFESAAKTAGALALGVAGAALLSALAIDVADTAILGAVAAAAGGAVLSGSGSSTKASRKSTTLTEDGEEVEIEEETTAEEERKITGAGETGVIIAAGLMSAFDAGRSMVESMTTTTTGAIEEEKESSKMDQE